MPLCECLADGAEYFDKGRKVFPLHANDSTLDAIEERLLHVRRRDHEDYVRLHAIIAHYARSNFPSGACADGRPAASHPPMAHSHHPF